MVMRQSLAMIATGAAAGLIAALAVARLLERLIEGTRPPDAITFLFTIATLFIVALSASYLPARRASRIDPMTALRQD
jgi:putative ABC transport system permease protein